MQFHLNGEVRDMPEPLTVLTVLSSLALREQRVAVEINGEVIPRSQHGSHEVQPGDRIEVVQAIGGG